jgi:hypothetical protein
MKNRNELMTVDQLHKILSDAIKNGDGDKFIFVNEYFVGNDDSYTKDNHSIYLPEVHVQDVEEYVDNTGDDILN